MTKIQSSEGNEAPEASPSNSSKADRSQALAGGPLKHASDCAVHNMPAYLNGPCDCGASTDEGSDN